MRNVFPNKHYKDERFVERKFEINEAELVHIIENYLRDHSEFEFDEFRLVNNRPMNIWLHAVCRTYLEGEDIDADQLDDMEIEILGEYDNNPVGM